MTPTCRKLIKIRHKKTGEEYFADCYAIWEDLGDPEGLQPTRSRQTEPSFAGLKAGKGYNGWIRVDDNVYCKPTTMNNFSFR